MDLAGQRGVVQNRDAGATRPPPQAGNRGGPPSPPPTANSGSAEPQRRQGRRAVGSGPGGPVHGGRRPQADGGSAAIRREVGSADEPRTEPELGRAAGGGRRSGAGGGGALRGPSGGQVPGEDPRGQRVAARSRGGGRGGRAVFPAGIRSRLRPRARGAGSARRGLRRSPSAGCAGTCGGGGGETEPRRVREAKPSLY